MSPVEGGLPDAIDVILLKEVDAKRNKNRRAREVCNILALLNFRTLLLDLEFIGTVPILRSLPEQPDLRSVGPPMDLPPCR